MPTSSVLTRLSAVTLFAGALALLPAHAAGLTAKECHAKFQAAKADKTLNGQSYKAFKASQCAATTPAAASAPSSPPTAAGASTASDTAASAPAKPTTAPAATAEPGPGLGTKPAAVASGNAVFPTSVSAQYSKLSAGKARMKTCLDQYHANKESGGNGGLKWIQKGGGYYSQCNAKLKG
ncbi:hypothetical protein [Tanticharoenia sakaeratensis]|uniref:Uncharacterized protein n=1 Tax=Tanticharoenia sakaeratensis NBRC 103193 TaxID=1231623 RepID=A0A0D6MIU8_9PROT|nr:hypothetical protein [Tanticharoenia sakaeratensis]GAN53552.1 hypothetical protein Tasa_010_099 [Tanticharoenia sakaeratensis NBRC 103193]GBQ17574.1 hypothetical protein AA103193_0388 [Tanticharoenia sakaeratensis NBRC 103193]